MTYEETIKKIMDFLIGAYQMLIDGNVVNDEKDSYRNLIKVCETAKQAIEKQIPKKPVKIKGEYKDKFICPACKSEEVMTGCDPFLDYGLNYCNNCGQALDWSDEND